MSDFDLTEYLAQRDGAFSKPPEDINYLTPKQRQIADASATKLAGMRQTAERQAEVLDINSRSLIGRLDLDPNSLIGNVVDKMAATVNTGVGIVSKGVTAPLNFLADSAEKGITEEQKSAFVENKALTENAPFSLSLEQSEKARNAQRMAAAGLDQGKIDRLTAAMKTRDLANTVNDATNLDSLVRMDPVTGERTSGLQSRVVGDATLKLASGFVSADESLVGLASLVSGGEAGAKLKDLGFDFPATQKALSKLMTPEQQLADSKTQNAVGFSDTLDAALSNPSTIAGGIIQSVPSMMVGGAIGKAVKAVAPIGAGVAGAIGEGTIMAGQQAENIRNGTEDKRLTLKQSLLAVGTGVMGAAVGVAGNKLAHGLKVADIDEALVTGAVGQAQRSGLARVVLPAAIEGGEELLQSSGEQVAQNVALDKPFNEGVGNAAAMGLVTGAPMGAMTGFTEHAVDKASKQTNEQQQVAQFQDAVDKADPAPYLNKTDSTNYAPDKAVAVLFAASQKADVTPELQSEHAAKAETIVAELEQEVSNRKQDLVDASPEGQAKMQAEIAQYAAAGNTPMVEALTQGLADAQSITPEQKTQLSTQLDKLETSLATAQQVNTQLKVLVSPKAEEVATQVQAAATEPAAAQKVVTFAMNHPDSLSQSDLTGLINDESNALTTEQRTYLRQFDEARVARNKLQTAQTVNEEITVGTDQHWGLQRYQKVMGQALAQGDVAKQDKVVSQLAKFATDHTQKYRTAFEAYKQARDTAQPVQIVNQDGQWQIHTGTPFSQADLTQNGGLEIRGGKFSRPLVQNLQDEAKAIAYTLREFKAAQAVAPTALSATPVAPTVAPVDVTTPSAKAEGVPGTPELSAPATQQQEQEQDRAATEEELNTDVRAAQDESGQVTSPEELGEVSGQLDVFSGERAAKVDNSNYRAVNGLRQFFEQRTNQTQPLTAVKNFLSQTGKTLKDFVPEQSTSVQQDKVLDLFTQAAGLWNSTMQKLLPTKIDSNFSYEKPIEFFINPETGDLEENVKTAISVAMFSWLNEHGRDLVGSKQHITRLLNWDKDARINKATYDAVGHLGSRESLVANDLGQTILQVLGIKAQANAPLNERARIEAGIGQFAIAVLLDQKLVERQFITKGELVKLGAKLEKNTNLDEVELELQANDPTKVYFLAVSTADTDVQEIMAASTGSQNVLDKTFATGRRATEPSRTAPEYTKDTTQNTDQPAPQSLIDNLNQLTKQPWKLITDRVQILRNLPDELVNAMIGVVPVDEKRVHKDNRRGLQAKNDALLRGKDAAFQYITQLETEGAMDAELFMEYSIWKHHRVGMTGTVLNPQTDKTHRFLVGMSDWTTTINPKNRTQMEDFLLQVGAGLGVKIDKQGKKDSIRQLKALIQTDVMQEGLAAISSALAGDTLDTKAQQAIADAVAAGGENLHSFASLVETVKYQAALAKGETFVSNLMGEVDGVTNGPMLSQILFGTISQEIAEKGGFYAQGATATDYPTWRGQEGHQDFYETLATRLTEHLKTTFDFEDLNPIFQITGDLTVKVDRNIVKRPLTAVNYGSSMGAAIAGMADEFIEKLYGNIEQLAAKPDQTLAREQLQTLLSAVSDLLHANGQAKISTDVSVETMMDTVLSGAQEVALKKAFTDTVGVAMEAALNDTLGEFISARDTFNEYGRLAFDLYDTVYQHMRDSFVQQNLADGTIASRTKKSGEAEALHELTTEQEALIRKRLAHMDPVMATAISSRGNNKSQGVRLASSDKSLGDSVAYSGQIALGQTVPSASGEKPVKTMRFRGFSKLVTGPGVSSLVNGVQSTDSGIMSQVYQDQAILNIHDAGGSGINKLGQMAQALNQSTFNNLLAYSPPAAMQQTLTDVLTGLADVMLDNQDTDLANKLQAVLDKAQVINTRTLLENVKTFANTADKAKLEFLSQQEHISQYGLAGHSYAVTEENRQAVVDAQAKLVTSLDPKVVVKLAQLDNTLNRKEKEAKAEASQPKVSSWGKIGVPSAASNPALLEFFRQQPERTAAEVLDVVERQLGSDTEGQYLRKLVKLLTRSVNPDLSVQMITGNTPFDGQDMTQLSRASGWMTTANGQPEVFVLSPEFSNGIVTPELVLHELVHATVALEIENPSSAEAKQHIAALEQLLKFAQGYLNNNPALADLYKDAVSNVHELVSYGLTNKDFQNKVLRQVQVPNVSKGSRFTNAMKKFVDSVAGLLFKDSRLSQHNQAINGLTVLIENASALVAATKESTTPGSVTLAMNAADPLAQLKAMSSVEVFERLGSASVAFSAHLRQLQVNVADKLHGPFGVIKDALAAEQALTPADRFLKAVASGTLPFSSAAQVSGVTLTQQESFLFEQVEAIMQASTDNTGSTTVAYRELAKLYEEAKAKITPAEIGQAAWDFVFLAQQKADGKSDYLARFAAMGLAHEGMAHAMQFSTKLNERNLNGMTFWEKVQAVFERVLETLHSRLTHTQPGQVADSKLATLVEQLVGIEAKRRTLLANPKNGFNDLVEAQTRKLNDAVRAGLTQASNSKFLRENSNSAVRAFSGLASTVFGERMDFFIEGVQKLRDQQFKQRPGLVMGLFNEIRGSHDGNLTAHELLRATNNNERMRKHLITDTEQLVLGSFANNGEDMTKETKAAITQVALRSDMQALLDHYTQAELEQLLSDPALLKAEIAARLTNLKQVPHFRYYQRAAKDLAYFMATGRVRTPNLAKNVLAIAELYGTRARGTVSTKDSKAAQAQLDPLVSLLALQYNPKAEQIQALAQVFRAENARGNESGMQFTLRMHKELQQQARERLFDGSEGLMLKGYVPEVFNPHVTLVAANAVNGLQLQRMGYAKSDKALEQDKADPYAEETHLYRLEDGGLKAYVTGIMSTTGLNAKGSTVHNGEFDMQGQTLHAQNQRHSALIERRKAAAVAALFNSDTSYEPGRERGNHLAPVFNPQGQAVNYAYLMNHETKDVGLERNNSFEDLLGKFAGATFDKETSAIQNRRAVEAAHQQYTEEYATRPDNYLVVGPSSTDASLREAYKLLPKSTQQAIQDVWGSPNMLIRSDLIDMFVGYRKFSLTDMFQKQAKAGQIPGKAKRNAVEEATVMFWSYIMADRTVSSDPFATEESRAAAEARAALKLRQAEDVWQEIVSEIKDILVVKSGLTLLGNVLSNFSELYWIGVPLMDMVKHHRVALRGVTAYRKDAKELYKLQQLLATGTLQGSLVDMQQRVIQLEDGLARNPVKELIDAGLLPTIVEDVAQEHDDYSYKTKLTKKTERFTSQVNPHIRNLGRQLYVSHDTALYQFLSQSTQISDFLARYTAYQHMTGRKQAPMTNKEAVQFVADAFVNYDIPTHRTMQYLNDMGIIWFTKYYLRIQKVIMHLFRDNPARAFMLMGIEHFFNGAQTLLDSGFMHHFNNPLSVGAFKYPGSLDELATMNALLSPFGLTSSASWPGQ